MCLSLPLLSGIALSTLLTVDGQVQEYDPHRDILEEAFTAPAMTVEARKPARPAHPSPDYDVDRDILYIAPKS